MLVSSSIFGARSGRQVSLGLLIVASLAAGGLRSARAEYLFNGFLVPSYPTQYSAWDVFYTPYGNINYPDFSAPYGAYGPAPAGYAIPSNANPTNPKAFWDTRNATITQVGTSTAFITSPGVPGAGNIYSFAGATGYLLNQGGSAGVGIVALQYQTDGTLLDFSSFKLVYTNSAGTSVSLPPNDFLREYRTSGSSFGGIANRAALEWNLTGLGVTSFQLLFSAPSSSNSLQLVSLDTAASYGAILPPVRDWNAVGGGNWSNGANWQQGATSSENGNVRFINPAAALPLLDANHTIGELRFNTAANVTLNSPGGYALTANTGITSTAAAVGIYLVNAGYALGAYNIFDLAAGDVRLAGVVSGGYGMEKDGVGSLALTGDNTFTGGVTVGDGTLTFAGRNNYTAPTEVVAGTLVVAAGGSLANTTVTVDSGATFTNNGTVAGGVNVTGTLNGMGAFGGQVLVQNTASFASTGALNGGFNVAQGATVSRSGGTLTVRGAVTNNGTIRFTKGATLDVSGATSVYNNGLLDFLSGNLTLPSNVTIVNGPNGRVLTSNLLKIHNTLTRTSTRVSVGCDGYAGHVYQLQRSATLVNASYANVGSPQAVAADTAPANPLNFDDLNPSGTQGFYRVAVDP